MHFVGLVVIDRCGDDNGEDDSAKLKMMFLLPSMGDLPEFLWTC